MRRLTNIFGGEKVGPLGGGFGNGGWETNSLVSDLTTVLCLDDYHLNDRNGRKESGLTALNPVENNFDLMFEQMKALKSGETISKPIYNHVNGTLDEPETIEPTPIVIIEGLHPMYDERVRDLLDFSLYLDISDEVKLNWKVQRDMEERGHSLESIMASIEARKPDFDAYIAPQKEFADICDLGNLFMMIQNDSRLGFSVASFIRQAILERKSWMRDVCVQCRPCTPPDHWNRNLFQHPPSVAEFPADFERTFTDDKPWF